MEKVLVKRLSATAVLPTRATPWSAGLDLYSAHELVIPPQERGVVKTDLSIHVPPGHYGRIAGRSGLALSQGLCVLGGVCDADFCGNVAIILLNTEKTPFTVKSGQRVAQFIIERISFAEVVEVTDLPSTIRGDAGFGSSGF